MDISIIIPTFNEAQSIGQLISYLNNNASGQSMEIIVTDGGSTDNTLVIAEKAGVKPVSSPVKGRAAQMHYAALQAKGDILYFIHADTFPPSTYATDITGAVNDGYHIGRYRTSFRSRNLLLKINQWFTRFDWLVCMGGDQTLFVEKNLYHQAGGFDSSKLIMEEYYFGMKARSLGRYKVLQGKASVSARKYEQHSWLSVQWANYKAFSMFKKGHSTESVKAVYNQLLQSSTNGAK
jgi:rSAM/selenodomain-associated transferase 2